MRRTLVISDIHLCPIDRRSECLSAHRRPENQPDAAVASVLNASIRKGVSEVVLNGDIFDFDTPDCVHRHPEDLAGYLDATLTDHMRVLSAFGNLVRAGVVLTFIGGNHDAPMAYPEVRRTLATRIAKAAGKFGGVQFRTWVHRTPDCLVIIEHGHVYDPLCVLEAPELPTELTVGAVVARRVNDVLPCLNPHSSDPTALRATQYLSALKCAIQDGPEKLLETVVASAHAVRDLSAVTACARGYESLCRLAAGETGIPIEVLRRHAQLFAAKLCLKDLPDATRSRTDGVQQQMEAADQIAMLHDVHAVVMGHTHVPKTERLQHTWFGNSGVWASEAGIAGDDRSAAGHFVWIESDGSRLLHATTLPWQKRDTVAA